MTRRLILGRIPDDFMPTSDIAAGPWCFIGREDVCDNWENLEFIDALADQREFEAADRLTCRLASELVVDWGRKLNTLHKIDQPPLFWRFILIAWTLASVQALYARFLHMEALVERYRDTALEVQLVSTVAPVKAEGLIDFLNYLRRSPQFDYWMSSFILRRSLPKNWHLVEIVHGATETTEASNDLPPPFEVLERPSRIKFVLSRCFGRFPVESVPGMRISKVLLSLYLAFLPKRGVGRHLIELEVSADESVKAELPTRFLELLEDFMTVTMPRAYGEGFKAQFAEVEREKIYPGRVFVSNFLPSDERRRILYARAAVGGEKLISTQHGNGYGVHRWNPWASEFEYPYHAFLTWGWTQHQDYKGKFIGLPSPLLGQFAERHRETSSVLALVGTKMDLRDVRIFPPRPSGCLSYRKKKTSFIEALSSAPKQNLVYYPYSRGEADLEDEEYMLRHYKNLQVKKSGLNHDIVSMRLLVVDHIGTSINLGLAGNTPTVCFWDPDTFLISEAAERDFEALRACGILHDDPVSAARHINDVWENIDQWWMSEAVQKGRKMWLSKNGLTSKFWWWKWLGSLTKLQLTDHCQSHPTTEVNYTNLRGHKDSKFFPGKRR